MENGTVETKEKVKGISLRVLAVLAVTVIFLGILFFLTDEIVLENQSSFDLSVFRFLDRFRSPGLTSVLIFFTFFGSINFLLPAYV
ncbi:MAG: hypothetical protein M3040_15660, partial [Bacteroidota bacterium]|nr:hypothetical protein [Bacteroidota bacterium]